MGEADKANALFNSIDTSAFKKRQLSYFYYYYSKVMMLKKDESKALEYYEKATDIFPKCVFFASHKKEK